MVFCTKRAVEVDSTSGPGEDVESIQKIHAPAKKLLLWPFFLDSAPGFGGSEGSFRVSNANPEKSQSN